MATALVSALSAALSMLRQLWFRASQYLPFLVMLLLALGTWWLASNSPTGSAPTLTDAQPKHEPDYEMRDFAVKNFDAAGRLSSEIAGKVARHYPDTDVLEIDGARIRGFAPARQTVATALRAYSNADGSEVQLVGDARVVRESGQDAQGQALPRMEFRGEFIQAFTLTEKIKSHKPVTLTRGGDQFVADSLDYDNVERTALLKGRVKATLAARPKP
jgi:lipopolysaccharide export system protein LptC